MWDEVAHDSKKIQELATKGEGKTPTFTPLLQDVFSSFYKSSPALRDEVDVEPAHLANRPLVDELLKEPVTEQARSFTVLDQTASALAALAAGQKMLEIVAKDPEVSKALDNFSQQLQAGPHPGGNAGNQAKYTPAAQQAAAQVQRTMANAPRLMQKAARQAAREAVKEAEQAQQIAASWGLDPGSLQRVPLGERLSLVQTLSTDRFRKMGELIGRMRNLGRAKQAQKIRHQADEIHRIATGNHLARVLPQELASLNHPLLKLDFGRKFIEGRLMEYELRPRPKNARGPIICLIDASGSMAGNPIEWAAAVGLALLDIARSQKRDFAAAYFRGPGAKLDTFRFTKQDGYDPREILRFATMGANGGTSFEEPLSWALEVQNEGPFHKADIVMVTDGECKVSDPFLKKLLAQKTERELQIFSFLIGGTPEELTRWSDRVWAMGGPDDGAASELFSEI